MHIYNKSVRIFYFKTRLFVSRLWKYNWTLLMVRNRTFLAHGSIRLHINWKKYSLKLEAFPALLNLFTKINSNKNPTPKMANDFIMFAFTFFLARAIINHLFSLYLIVDSHCLFFDILPSLINHIVSDSNLHMWFHGWIFVWVEYHIEEIIAV